MKISLPILCFVLFNISLPAQSETKCDEIAEKVDTEAFLAPYAELSAYDQVWYTDRDIAAKVHEALEPRDTNTLSGKSGKLSFTITSDGRLQDFAFASPKHEAALEIAQAALADMPLLRAATLNGKAVCSKRTIKINFEHVMNPSSGKLMKEFIYKKPMYDAANCADLSADEQKTCSERAMLMDLYKNIKYPAIARENSVQGMVVISFVVNKDGSTSDHRIVRNIGGGCGEESLRVVKRYLKNWSPGLDENKEPIRVGFNLPVRFKLH